MLNIYHPELPLCTRALSGTACEKVRVMEMHQGSYFQIGIEVSISKNAKISKCKVASASPQDIYWD